VVQLKEKNHNAVPITVLVLCCLAFLLLSIIACKNLSKMAAAEAEKHPQTIVVDAGHGGEDGGAIGKSPIPEKDINLAISKDLQQLLTAAGYRVLMTRTTDTSLSDPLNTIHERKVSDLHNRLKLIQSQGNCIFISIHQNFFEQSQYSGAQVFYSTNNEKSKAIAEAIRSQVVGQLQKNNSRAIKPATSSIYLLWNAKVPAVLVECGFLSNEQEAAALNQESYQKKMAFCIYCGLLDYLSNAG
jgi:N-acetylmuramoyl-L-alanine amidase